MNRRTSCWSGCWLASSDCRWASATGFTVADPARAISRIARAVSLRVRRLARATRVSSRLVSGVTRIVNTVDEPEIFGMQTVCNAAQWSVMSMPMLSCDVGMKCPLL